MYQVVNNLKKKTFYNSKRAGLLFEKQCCHSQIFQNSSINLLHWLDKLANFDQFQKPSKPVFTKLSNRVAPRNGPNKMAASSSGQLERTVPITRPDLIISGLCVCLCVRLCVWRTTNQVRQDNWIAHLSASSSLGRLLCCPAGYTLGKICTHKSRAALFAELSKGIGTFFFLPQCCGAGNLNWPSSSLSSSLGTTSVFTTNPPPPLCHVSQTI